MKALQKQLDGLCGLPDAFPAVFAGSRWTATVAEPPSRGLSTQAVAAGMVRFTDQALGLVRSGQISLAQEFRGRLD